MTISLYYCKSPELQWLYIGSIPMAVSKIFNMLTTKQEEIINSLKECFIEHNKLIPNDFMGIKEFNETRKEFVIKCVSNDDNFRKQLQDQLLVDQKIAQESLIPLGFEVFIQKHGGNNYLVAKLGKREIYLKYSFYLKYHKEYGFDSISGVRIDRGNTTCSDIKKALELCYDDIKAIYIEANP